MIYKEHTDGAQDEKDSRFYRLITRGYCNLNVIPMKVNITASKRSIRDDFIDPPCYLLHFIYYCYVEVMYWRMYGSLKEKIHGVYSKVHSINFTYRLYKYICEKVPPYVPKCMFSYSRQRSPSVLANLVHKINRNWIRIFIIRLCICPLILLLVYYLWQLHLPPWQQHLFGFDPPQIGPHHTLVVWIEGFRQASPKTPNVVQNSSGNTGDGHRGTWSRASKAGLPQRQRQNGPIDCDTQQKAPRLNTQQCE